MSEFAFAAGEEGPRKRPAQDRSRETIAAILEATFQILERDGEALTTTRVAEAAGVSVGTLYQYFPNRTALINGALAEHLEAVVGAIELAAADAQARPTAEAAERVVRAFLVAKASRAPVTRVLNRVFSLDKLDDRAVVRAASRRAQIAIARVLAAGGVPDTAQVRRAEIACALLESVVRTAIDSDLERLHDPTWTEQIVRIAVRALTD